MNNRGRGLHRARLNLAVAPCRQVRSYSSPHQRAFPPPVGMVARSQSSSSPTLVLSPMLHNESADSSSPRKSTPAIEFHPSVLTKQSSPPARASDQSQVKRTPEDGPNPQPLNGGKSQVWKVPSPQAEFKLNPEAPAFKLSPTDTQKQQEPIEKNGCIEPCQDGMQVKQICNNDADDVGHQQVDTQLQYYPVQYPLMAPSDGLQMQPVYLTMPGFSGVVMTSPLMPSTMLPWSGTSVEPVTTTNGTVHYYKYWQNGMTMLGGQQTMTPFVSPEPMQQVAMPVWCQPLPPMESSPLNTGQQSANPAIAGEPPFPVRMPGSRPYRGRGRRFNWRQPGSMARFSYSTNDFASR